MMRLSGTTSYEIWVKREEKVKAMNKSFVIKGVLVSIYFFFVINILLTLSLQYVENSTFKGVKYLILTVGSILILVDYWLKIFASDEKSE
jgi:hypothetical protein